MFVTYLPGYQVNKRSTHYRVLLPPYVTSRSSGFIAPYLYYIVILCPGILWGAHITWYVYIGGGIRYWQVVSPLQSF